MIVKVVAAFRLLGRLKLGTPLLTASTPVSAVQPWAKARRASSSTAAPAVPCVPCTVSEADSAVGGSPRTVRTRPAPTMRNTLATKPYVGMAKARPDSRTPRRFITAMPAIATIETPTACGASAGTAETMLATPAATETATVIT